MQLIAVLLACVGFGIYAITKQYLPVGPRRKVIDAPAIWLGMTLILLPFVAVAVFLVWRWIAGCLSGVQRWSVPKLYHGTWVDYVPYQPKKSSPDFSMLDASTDATGNVADDG